jgi:hypothetical protein
MTPVELSPLDNGDRVVPYEGPRRLRAFRDNGIYRDTVTSNTVMSSFSNSPWMRGSPQRKFARAISPIGGRVSRAILGALTSPATTRSLFPNQSDTLTALPQFRLNDFQCVAPGRLTAQVQ